MNFILDPSGGMPFYRQIIDQIKFGIASGNLKTGEQLPTVRALAVELKVNLNTIAKAYKELEILGILDTQQGSGTFINANGIVLTDEEKQRKIQDICKEFLTVAFSYGFSKEDVLTELQNNTFNNNLNNK
ncbi:MAG TPA: GntR family transcriptional regulator [Prolixibacteraceae bacterium]